MLSALGGVIHRRRWVQGGQGVLSGVVIHRARGGWRRCCGVLGAIGTSTDGGGLTTGGEDLVVIGTGTDGGGLTTGGEDLDVIGTGTGNGWDGEGVAGCAVLGGLGGEGEESGGLEPAHRSPYVAPAHPGGFGEALLGRPGVAHVAGSASQDARDVPGGGLQRACGRLDGVQPLPLARSNRKVPAGAAAATGGYRSRPHRQGRERGVGGHASCSSRSRGSSGMRMGA